MLLVYLKFISLMLISTLISISFLQVHTLKQTRAAYDELSAGYKKLLAASGLYDRDNAAAAVQKPKEKPLEASPPPKPNPAAFVRKMAPKAGLLNEGDDYYSTLVPQQPAATKSTRPSSRGGFNIKESFQDDSGGNMTFITHEMDS